MSMEVIGAITDDATIVTCKLVTANFFLVDNAFMFGAKQSESIYRDFSFCSKSLRDLLHFKKPSRSREMLEGITERSRNARSILTLEEFFIFLPLKF